ncbi:MAG: DUF1850 domain-containing protein [Bacillota bacterium]
MGLLNWKPRAHPCALLALCIVLWLWPRGLVLEVRAADGAVQYARQVSVDDVVELSHVHSVEQTLVVERFTVVPKGLRLVMTSFGSAGAGLPASHAGLVTRDGRFVIEELDTVLCALPLLGSDATRSQLELHGASYALRGRVTVSVRAYPTWHPGWRRGAAGQ